MRVLSLSGAQYVAVISSEDFRRCNRYVWHVHFSKGKGRAKGEPYARTNINGKKVYLHRFVMGCPKGLHVDHLNHCTLDCRRENLEIVTHSENLKRRRKYAKTL